MVTTRNRQDSTTVENTWQQKIRALLHQSALDAYTNASVEFVSYQLPTSSDSSLALDNTSHTHWWLGRSEFPAEWTMMRESRRLAKQGGTVGIGYRRVKDISKWSTFECIQVSDLLKIGKICCMIRCDSDVPYEIDPASAEEQNEYFEALRCENTEI